MIDGHGDDLYQYGEVRCNFSSNISPFIDTRLLRRHLASRLQLICHYPEPSAHSLEVLIAAEHHVRPAEVLVTSGATDAIYLIAQTLRSERTFAVERPTFSEYADACRIYGYEEPPAPSPVCCCITATQEPPAALRWLCNPNNPTGQVLSVDTVKALARRHRWLVIDQSYEDYTYSQPLAAREAIDMQNVIVIHSMTKRFAIPGLRLGYIIAPSPVVSRLRASHRPWAVNALAIEAGRWLLTHKNPNEHLIMQALLRQTRILANRLRSISGIHVYPTETTYMLCSIQQGSAAQLKDYLLTRHRLLIRDASNFEGLNDSHFRIAAQQSQFNDELAEAIAEYADKVKD